MRPRLTRTQLGMERGAAADLRACYRNRRLGVACNDDLVIRYVEMIAGLRRISSDAPLVRGEESAAISGYRRHGVECSSEPDHPHAQPRRCQRLFSAHPFWRFRHALA